MTATTTPLAGIQAAISSAFASGNNIALLGNSIVAQGAHAFMSTGDAAWGSNKAYALNAYAIPQAQDLTNGYINLRYKVTTAGTSGAIEPVFSTVVGGTVTDGTVVWTTEATTAQPNWPQGWWHFAQGMSGQRLNEVFIVGRSGQKSSDILAYLPRVLAASPDIVFFANVLENNCWPGVAPALSSITADWNEMFAAMELVRSLGKRVMVQTVLPSGNIDSNGTAFAGYVRGNGTKAWQWLNAKIREYARARPDVIFFDAASVYVDPNFANPVWPENATTYLSGAATGQLLKKTDGIHPYVAAGYALGAALAPVLAANFPAVFRFGTAADLNAQSKNPLNYGTGGTSGSQVSAACVPNLMTLNAYSATAAAAATLVPRTDIAGNWLQFAYAATAADNLDYNTGPISLNNFAVGDVVQAFSEIKVLANPTQLKQLNAILDFSPTGIKVSSGLDVGSTSQDMGQFITTDTLFMVKTVPMRIPTGTANLICYSKVFGRGAASFTAQYGRSAVVRAATPALS